MYYIGVDGGGTKTIAVLVNRDGELIEKVELGAGNIAVLGAERARGLIENLITSLLNKNQNKEIAWATFAFAGMGRDKERTVVKESLQSLGIDKFSLLTDAEILYYSTFEDNSGILIASGTGSVCLIREAGKLKQIGGWGYLLGDEGSGFDIGRQALRKALAGKQNNKPPSLMTNQLFEFYVVNSVEALISKIYSQAIPQHSIASCAKVIGELAAQKEHDAIEIIESAANALLKLAQIAAEKVGGMPPYKLALAGSILRESSPVYDAFIKLAKKHGMAFEYVKPDLSPVAGAVLHAIKQTTESISFETRNNLINI